MLHSLEVISSENVPNVVVVVPDICEAPCLSKESQFPVLLQMLLQMSMFSG